MRRFQPRSALALALAILLVIGAPAGAYAQDERPKPDEWFDTNVGIAEPEADGQLTSLTSAVTCATPPPGQSQCAVTLRTMWRATAQGKYAATGTARFVGSPQQVTVPAAATVSVTVNVPPAQLRDVLARTKTAAIVELRATIDGYLVDTNSAYASLRNPSNMCGTPRFTRHGGAKLDTEFERNTGKGLTKTWIALTSPDLEIYTRYRVRSGSVAFTIHGVRYQLPKGSEFNITCSGLGAVKRGRLFATLYLARGSVRTTGKPRGSRQPAVSILTNEGSLGTRTAESVDLTVKRNVNAQKSSMLVRRGRTGQITPWKSQKSSPCTNGRRLTVDRRGRIRSA